MLIENVQEPLGALEVGQKRELLTDATHLHLLFPGSAIFCLFVEDAVSFSTPWSAIVLSFFSSCWRQDHIPQFFTPQTGKITSMSCYSSENMSIFRGRKRKTPKLLLKENVATFAGLKSKFGFRLRSSKYLSPDINALQ